jgi:hypothetical protein
MSPSWSTSAASRSLTSEPEERMELAAALVLEPDQRVPGAARRGEHDIQISVAVQIGERDVRRPREHAEQRRRPVAGEVGGVPSRVGEAVQAVAADDDGVDEPVPVEVAHLQVEPVLRRRDRDQVASPGAAGVALGVEPLEARRLVPRQAVQVDVPVPVAIERGLGDGADAARQHRHRAGPVVGEPDPGVASLDADHGVQRAVLVDVGEVQALGGRARGVERVRPEARCAAVVGEPEQTARVGAGDRHVEGAVAVEIAQAERHWIGARAHGLGRRPGDLRCARRPGDRGQGRGDPQEPAHHSCSAESSSSG